MLLGVVAELLCFGCIQVIGDQPGAFRWRPGHHDQYVRDATSHLGDVVNGNETLILESQRFPDASWWFEHSQKIQLCILVSIQYLKVLNFRHQDVLTTRLLARRTVGRLWIGLALMASGGILQLIK